MIRCRCGVFSNNGVLCSRCQRAYSRNVEDLNLEFSNEEEFEEYLDNLGLDDLDEEE